MRWHSAIKISFRNETLTPHLSAMFNQDRYSTMYVPEHMRSRPSLSVSGGRVTPRTLRLALSGFATNGNCGVDGLEAFF